MTVCHFTEEALSGLEYFHLLSCAFAIGSRKLGSQNSYPEFLCEHGVRITESLLQDKT